MKNNKGLEIHKNFLYRSLFKKPNHFSKALKLLETAMSGNMPSVKLGVEGAAEFDVVLNALSQEDPSLDYLEFEHVVELYLRHTPSLFTLEGTSLKSVQPVNFGKPVVPPEYLYFATAKEVAVRAELQGLRSLKHPNVVLTDNAHVARRKAAKFGEMAGDEPAVLKLKALEAHKNGIVFLTGNRHGLYMVPHLSKEYIDSRS